VKLFTKNLDTGIPFFPSDWKLISHKSQILHEELRGVLRSFLDFETKILSVFFCIFAIPILYTMTFEKEKLF
tara:strand:- start:324 stop:539 length:216 start_codon:yes stop_codon:yes gene_type:complete